MGDQERIKELAQLAKILTIENFKIQEALHKKINKQLEIAASTCRLNMNKINKILTGDEND